LTAAKRVFPYRHLEIILGSPLVDEDAWLAARHDDLCLALVKKPINSQGIAFTYDLNGTQPGHVGGVLGYRGEGDDTRMLAVLLRYVGETIVGALWFNDGNDWRPADQSPVIGLPNTGNAQVVTSGEQIILSIDEIESGRFRVTDGGTAGGVGVRWTNARIRNISGLNVAPTS